VGARSLPSPRDRHRTGADRVYNYEPDAVYVMRIGSRTRRARGATVEPHARGSRIDRGVMHTHPLTPARGWRAPFEWRRVARSVGAARLDKARHLMHQEVGLGFVRRTREPHRNPARPNGVFDTEDRMPRLHAIAPSSSFLYRRSARVVSHIRLER